MVGKLAGKIGSRYRWAARGIGLASGKAMLRRGVEHMSLITGRRRQRGLEAPRAGDIGGQPATAVKTPMRRSSADIEGLKWRGREGDASVLHRRCDITIFANARG